MKILRIIYDFADPLNFTGGLSPAPYELSLAQASLGDKVYVLCGNLNGKSLLKLRFKYKIGENITVINLPRALPHFGPFLTTSLFVLPYYFYFRYFKKIDLVHNHQHLGVWFLLYKYLFKSFDKLPVFGHYHVTALGREEVTLKNGGKLPFFTKYFEYPIHKFSDKLMSKVSTHIFCVAANIKDEVCKYYKVDPQKITVIESAVSITKFTKEVKKIDLGFENNSIILGNVGRISPRKGIDIMLDTLSKLPNQYKLVLWGDYQDLDYKNKITKLVHELKVENRFKYMGVIDYFHNQNAFASINIFILPSIYEGLPKVILEALVSGSIAIASGFKIEKEIPNLVFLNSVNSLSLLNEIHNVTFSEENYKRTMNIISEYYSYEQRARDIKDIYERFIK